MSEPTKRLYLIDAFAMIYRGYYPFARRPMLNRRGEDTSAVLGFVNTFDAILKESEGQYLAVVFDPPGGTFRHEEYEEYKAQREAQPEAISFALPYIREIIRARGVASYEVPGYEADDVIGTLATRFAREEPGLEVLMVTPDKDYGQLVTDRIRMLSPASSGGGFHLLGPAEVAAKHQLRDVSQVRDYLALVGDTADNVPGVPLVGPKTASKLLNDFGSIEGIYERIDEVRKGKMRDNLIAYREQLDRSRHLVTIVTDVPVDASLEEMVRGAEDTGKLRSIYSELDFRSKLRGLEEEQQPEEAKRSAPQRSLFDVPAPEEAPEPPEETELHNLTSVEHRYRLVDDAQSLKELIGTLERADRFALQPLIDGEDALGDRLVGVAFSTKPHEGWFVPLRSGSEADGLAPFAPLLLDPEKMVVGHNLKRTLKSLSRLGLTEVTPLRDVMLEHYLLDPGAGQELGRLAERELRYLCIDPKEFTGTGRKRHRLSEIAPEELLPLAAEAADVVLQLDSLLAPKMEEEPLHRLFNELEMPLLSVLLRMELAGVRVDETKLRGAIAGMQQELDLLEEQIYAAVDGYRFNIASPKEVGELLFDRLALVAKPKKTPSGQYSTREEELEKLRPLHPVVGMILDHRSLSKLLGTYLIPLPTLIRPETGRIHTTYHQAMTATGRLSSSDPNLQNIPVREERGREIRTAFTGNRPEAGDLFVSADYSQVELRLMAHFSEDRALIDAFRHGADIHAATASRIFGVAPEEVTPEMRRRAKTANFGIIYGISPFGLSSRLEIPMGEAAQLIDSYFASFPGVKDYMDRTIESARKEGYVETLFGRRRYLYGITSRNRTIRANAERMAINAPIQGTAADLIKVAMLRIDRRLREEGYLSEMILQVHDELCFTVPADEREQLVEMVRSEMEQVLPTLRVPLVVEVGSGANWLEAH